MEDPHERLEVPPREEGEWCRLRYRLGGIFYDMVPAGVAISAVRREAVALVRLGLLRDPLASLRRGIARLWRVDPTHCEGRVRLVLGTTSVSIVVSSRAPGAGPDSGAVVLSLAVPEGSSAEASELLDRLVSRFASSESGEENAPA